MRLSEIKKKIPAFKSWLSGAGAEVLEPTNEWEVVRFRGNGCTSILYNDKQGRITLTGEAKDAWDSFHNGKAWRANPAPRRRPTSPVVKALFKRDGNRCFWCGLVIEHGNESVDHLVANTHGGPSHVSNYVLMHRTCNSHCGHMTAMEKIRAHVEWQLADRSING